MKSDKKKKENKKCTPKKTRGCRTPKQTVIPRTLKEALQIKLKEVISVEDSSGKTKKMPCLMAIADAIVRDCINKDGASRRFLLREGFLDLPVIEEEAKKEGKQGLNISEEDRLELQSLIVDLINDKSRT